MYKSSLTIDSIEISRMCLLYYISIIYILNQFSFRRNLTCTLCWVILHAYRKGCYVPTGFSNWMNITTAGNQRLLRSKNRKRVKGWWFGQIRPPKIHREALVHHFPPLYFTPTFAVDRHLLGTFSRTVVTSACLVVMQLVKNTQAAPSSRVYNL